MLTVAEDMDFFSSGAVVRTYHLWGLWGSHLFPWNCGHMTVGRGLHEGWKMKYEQCLSISRIVYVQVRITHNIGYHKHQVYIKNINHQPHEYHISTPFVFSSFVLYIVTIWGYGKPWVWGPWWNLKGPAPFVAGTLGSSMPAHCSKGPRKA